MQLPVGPHTAELLAERDGLLWRRKRVVPAVQREHTSADAITIRIARRIEQPVEADHTGKRLAGACNVERAQATEAVADGRDACCLNFRLVPQCLQGEQQPPLQHRSVSPQGFHDVAAFLDVAADRVPAVNVNREADIALFRQRDRLALFELAATAYRMGDEDTRARSIGPVIPGQHPFEYEVPVLIVDQARLDTHAALPLQSAAGDHDDFYTAVGPDVPGRHRAGDTHDDRSEQRRPETGYDKVVQQ